MYQNRLVAGLCPGLLGSSERLPDSLAGFRGDDGNERREGKDVELAPSLLG